MSHSTMSAPAMAPAPSSPSPKPTLKKREGGACYMDGQVKKGDGELFNYEEIGYVSRF